MAGCGPLRGGSLKPADSALLLLLSLIWGSAFLMIGVAVDDVAPLTMVAGRLILAGAMLTVIALVMGKGLPPRSTWGVLLVMAVLNNALPFTLITWAQQHITSSLAATLNATMPLFTFVIAAAIGSERATPERSIGLVVGFIGAAVVMGPDVTDLTSSSTLGELAVIAGSLGYAASTIVARQKASGDPVVLSSGQMVIGALIMLPVALIFDGRPDPDISAKAALSWAGLGVFSSGFAYIIYFTLIQRVSATSVALVSYLIPIVATVLGWAVLDEAIGVNLFAGMALIIAGMMLVNGTLRGLLAWGSPRSRGDAEGG